MAFRTVLSSFALAAVAYVRAADNGLALTPQMGWNTWNHFGCSISEDTILSAAQAIKDKGLDKLGYNCSLLHHLPLFPEIDGFMNRCSYG